ncbi:hypothetical protein KKB55_22740 [Myxococcota bacterium]|nr:hypothetical protein [Myxococcota bacterium]
MAEHAAQSTHAENTRSNQGGVHAQDYKGQPALDQSAEINASVTATGSGPNAAAYNQAREAHRRDVKRLDDTIAAGLNEHSTSYGEAWPNAAAWLRAGKTKLVALTHTHDAAARAKALGKADKLAMFGFDTAIPADSGYAETDLNDKTNIYCAKPTWGGFRMGGSPSVIAIIQASTYDLNGLKGLIVHEVQHDADHHPGSQMGSYQTEFRAYWIQQAMAHHKATSGSADPNLTTQDGTKLTGFDNRRQQAIFKHLWDCGSYDYVKDLWKDAALRQQLLAQKTPTGTNMVNSPMIDDVFLALNKGQSADAVIAAARKLTVEDLKALGSSQMRGEWEALINKRFSGPTRMRVLGALGMEPGAAGVQWGLIEQIYEQLQSSKANETKLNALIGQLTQADRAILQRAEMKSEWKGLVEKRFEGAARAQMLKALGLDQ